MKNVKATEFSSVILPTDLTPQSTSEFHGLVHNAVSSGISELRINCAQVENASSSHIGILWKAFDVCKSNNVKLILEEATTSLTRVLIILDLGELFGLGGYEINLKPADKLEIASGRASQVHSELICISREHLKYSQENFLGFLRKQGVPEIAEFEMRTVFYEVLTNIVDHSGLTENDKVKFTAKINDNHINLVFEDIGRAFDPTNYKGFEVLADLVAAAKDRRFKGFGLLMVRKLVDSIKYERKENLINRLEIEKQWS